MDKENNGLLKSLKIIAELILLLLAVGMAYATIREKVNTNRRDIDANCTAIKSVGDAQQSIKVNIEKINTRQEFISDDIKDIKEALKK